MLVFLSSILVSCVVSLCLPIPSSFEGTGIIPVRPEMAKSVMAQWSVKMLGRKNVYPSCAYESCYSGIQLIGKTSDVSPPFTTLAVFAFNHRFFEEIVTSHFAITLIDPAKQILYIYGIVENPDNVIYQKSIIPEFREIQNCMNDANVTMEILPLTNWAYGVYHFALSREL